MFEEVQPVRLPEIRAAHARLAGLTLVSPAIACNAAPADKVVRLKLENLQPIGSFKLRPVGNAVLARTRADSSGALASALSCRRCGR